MRDTTEIMESMERTRDEIRATLGEISERASVDRLMQQYVLPAKSSAAELARVLADAVRANPIPLGLTAIGLGWLMLERRSPPIALPPYDQRRGVYESVAAEPTLKEKFSAGVDDVLHRAGDAVEEGKARAAETAHDLKQRVGETAEDAKRRVGETVGKARSSARHFADETVGRVRDAAAKGRHWTAETADRASHTIRHKVDAAYGFTRDTASDVGGRVRKAARPAVGYAREHPMAMGAVLVLGGAALALLLSRRTGHGRDDAAAGAPPGVAETAYASGVETPEEWHRPPTAPITPEDEEPVFAAGDLSAEAIRPATGAEREEVAMADGERSVGREPGGA